MITSHNFLEDLAFVLTVAAFISVLCQALRQPLVVGYLVAGMLVGPHFPFPLLADIDRIQHLSEFGVILLMFALGLEFSVRKLVRLAPSAGFITVVQVGLLMWLGYEVGRAFGWTELEGVFTGALLAISSTTIIAKAFSEEKVSRSLSELVFGVALFEDLAAVIILAVLTAIATGAGLSAKMVAITVGQLVFFLAALVGGGMLIVPRAIRLAASFERDETLVVTSVGICFAIAMIAEKAGYSVALGAFLAGVLVSESGQTHKIEHLIAPLRDMFGAIFFVSVGMLLEPQVVLAHWTDLIALIGVVLVGKIVGVSIGAMLTGSSTRTSVQAGMSMAQIGEFSFIIVGAGLEHHATRPFLYSLAIAVSAITTFMTPFMIRASGRIGSFIDARLPQSVGMLQSMYDSWIEHLRARSHPHHIRGPVILIVIAIVSIIAIAATYEVTAYRLEVLVRAATGVLPDTAETLVQAMALVLAALPGIAIWRGAHSIGQRIAMSLSAAPLRSDEATEPDLANAGLLAGIFETAIVFGAATFLLAVIAPLMSLFDGLAVMVVVVLGLAFAIWRIARNLYVLMHSTSGSLIERLLLARQSLSAGAADNADSARVGPVTWVRVPDHSSALGMSLADLNLHAVTGAMVMAIARNGHGITLPGGEEVLRNGDTIALAGSTAAIEAARGLLAPPPTTEAIPATELFPP
jgi:CPA2 family monovalent cation:H+ antiporter-2